jgi:hypothetical protein
MFAVAVRTAGRRITGNHTWWLTAAPIAAGVMPVVVALLATPTQRPRANGDAARCMADVGLVVNTRRRV